MAAETLVVLCDAFPELSETFVANELRALRRAGWRVRVEADRHASRPDPGVAGEFDVRWREDEGGWSRCRDLAWLVARHPWRCLRDLRARRGWAGEEWVRPLRELAGPARRATRSVPKGSPGVGFGTPAHLHAHFAAGAALDAWRLAALLGRTWSFTAHAYDVFSAPRNLAAKLEAATFSVTVCEYNRAYLRTLCSPAAGARIALEVMGVDGTVFDGAAPPPGGRRVLAVGRLVEKKGFDVLIRAAAQVPGAEVVIVGEGPQRPALEALIVELGVGEGGQNPAQGGVLTTRVKLHGALPPAAVRDELARADVLAMPSMVAADGDRDSMPVVVKEALAMRRLVGGQRRGRPARGRPPAVRPARRARRPDRAGGGAGRAAGPRRRRARAPGRPRSRLGPRVRGRRPGDRQARRAHPRHVRTPPWAGFWTGRVITPPWAGF